MPAEDCVRAAQQTGALMPMRPYSPPPSAGPSGNGQWHITAPPFAVTTLLNVAPRATMPAAIARLIQPGALPSGWTPWTWQQVQWNGYWYGRATQPQDPTGASASGPGTAVQPAGFYVWVPQVHLLALQAR